MPSPHPTRSALLEAGLSIAEQHGLMNISIDQITREAGVAKGTFYVHFPDRVAYLVDLHRGFHDQLKEAILAATAQMPHGRDRLERGAITYLDGCLAGRGVKALLLEARSERAVADEVMSRNADFARYAEPDFEVMGWHSPAASARLFVALCAEAALAELETGGADADIRAALAQYIGG